MSGNALNRSEGTALKDIPKLLNEQNKLLEQQNIILSDLIETLKWLK